MKNTHKLRKSLPRRDFEISNQCFSLAFQNVFGTSQRGGLRNSFSLAQRRPCVYHVLQKKSLGFGLRESPCTLQGRVLKVIKCNMGYCVHISTRSVCSTVVHSKFCHSFIFFVMRRRESMGKSKVGIALQIRRKRRRDRGQNPNPRSDRPASLTRTTFHVKTCQNMSKH